MVGEASCGVLCIERLHNRHLRVYRRCRFRSASALDARSASHCDHPTPFQRGQTDTFTYKDVKNKEVNGVPLTPVTLGKFTLGKHGTSFTGDWTVASVKIVADGLVLYDNLVNQELNNAHQWLDDGKGNALNLAP